MSHEIETTAWTGQKPWHGLGTEMVIGQSMEDWMKAAGLDWEVTRLPMFTTLPNGENRVVLGKGGNEYAVLVRDRGTGKFGEEDIFGPVGPEWVPVQNSEVFKFIERFCSAGRMTIETCGALKGGTEVWVLAKFADDFDIVKGDTVKGYLLFHSAHVWGKGNQVRVTPIRVVCNNTLTMALSGTGSRFRLPHIRAFDAEVQQAAEQALGLAGATLDEFKADATFLASKSARPADLERFIARIYQPALLAQREKDNDKTPLVDDFSPSADGVMQALEAAPGHDLKGSKGTWWGAFNGVTYYEDHLRVSYKDDTNILASTWFGSGAKRKEHAMALAKEYAQ